MQGDGGHVIVPGRARGAGMTRPRCPAPPTAAHPRKDTLAHACVLLPFSVKCQESVQSPGTRLCPSLAVGGGHHQNYRRSWYCRQSWRYERVATRLVIPTRSLFVPTLSEHLGWWALGPLVSNAGGQTPSTYHH